MLSPSPRPSPQILISLFVQYCVGEGEGNRLTDLMGTPPTRQSSTSGGWAG